MAEIVRIQQVSKVYDAGSLKVRALDAVDLVISKHEFVAVMGPSGSGKSTLMNIIGCLDRPSEGRYFLDGIEVNGLSENQIAKVRNQKLGFVFQNFNLLPKLSALQNAALPLVYAGVSQKERLERAGGGLAAVGLTERMHHKPSELSGGQRQRAAIARALINRPELIIADEPTGNLDSKSSYEIMNLFTALHRRGHTLVMVTHEPDIAAYAKRIVRFKDGRIFADEQQEGYDALGKLFNGFDQPARS